MKNLIIALALAVAGAIIVNSSILGNGANTMTTQAANMSSAAAAQYNTVSDWD